MSVSDLTGTTWKITTTHVSYGYGIFSINFITPNFDPEYENSTLAIGYDYDFMDRDFFPSSNTLLCMPSFYYMGQNEEFLITGGTDATNNRLISWLESNATQIIQTKKEKIGNKSIVKMQIGNKKVLKEIVNGVIVYED